MTWTGGTRTTTVTHRARRARVLARDNYTCAWCARTNATVCDHRVPLAEGGQDTDDNCQAMCTTCHARKSSAEGGRARARRIGTTTRPPEPHPGIRTT